MLVPCNCHHRSTHSHKGTLYWVTSPLARPGSLVGKGPGCPRRYPSSSLWAQQRVPIQVRKWSPLSRLPEIISAAQRHFKVRPNKHLHLRKGKTGSLDRRRKASRIWRARPDFPEKLSRVCLGSVLLQRQGLFSSFFSFFLFSFLPSFLPSSLPFLSFPFRERGREGERGRETSMCERYIDRLPLVRPLLGTWPATQACVLTGNRACKLSVLFAGWRSAH